ncbi:MAG TPA: glucoamylase family protein [Pyrinomonadaceae bacterium]|nr:glucoamylase family protein [Pyrinomonadaceae bacterium]
MNQVALLSKHLPRLVAVVLLLSIFVQSDLGYAVRAEGRRDKPSQAERIKPSDEVFLEDLSRRSFQYFWERADPQTGLTLDRARTDGTPHAPSHQSHNIASIGATGFGLTALCIGAERKWVERGNAAERVRTTLSFFADRAFHQRGWFYHWMDAKTGERRWKSEVSSIDTAFLLAGILTARKYFGNDPEIVRLATKIYERVDFRWMLNGHATLLSHGWRPETGFLKPRWDTYSEDTILYMLAIGSPTHPISPRSWYGLWRDRYRYGGYSYFTTVSVPLFMHQYSHAWIDFRNRREIRGDRINYFENSINATHAHRAYCLTLVGTFPGYGPNVWGITASDSVKGYVAWGGPPHDPAVDGTVVPCAAAGSLMFTPDISLAALRTMREKFGSTIYGRYGFVDAFNPTTGWIGPDVIGIDVGITLLSAENLRTGFVWRHFMRNHEIPRAMRLIGLNRTVATRASLTNYQSHFQHPVISSNFSLPEYA